MSKTYMRMMRLSKNEIRALIILTSSTISHTPQSLSMELGTKLNSVYKILNRLENKGLVRRVGPELHVSNTPLSESFKELWYAHRTAPFEHIIADRRIELIFALDTNFKSADNLSKVANIPRKTIYYYLKWFRDLNIVKLKFINKNQYIYSFNYKLWPELKRFVEQFVAHEVLKKIPAQAVLIKDYGSSTLFKSTRILDATLTSFSVYKTFDIELLLRENFYTLPKRTMSIKEIFIHSLDSADNIAFRTYCILFYLKYRNNLKNVRHPMIYKIKQVLKGRDMNGYPNLDDIIDRADLYGIELLHIKSTRCNEDLSAI